MLQALRADPAFEVSLIVTGQHLAVGEDESLAAVGRDGFAGFDRVDIEIGLDTPEAVTRSTGLAVIGLGTALAKRRPDLLLVLGDRYEILAAATAALIARIPVAHLCGGDVTEGAIDDAIRHAITKMAHVHLVSNEDARRRVIQLGEDPAHVYNVGSPGLDHIRLTQRLGKAALFENVGLVPRARNLLVTYHPVTLDADPLAECREMLAALAELDPDCGIIFTGANADPGARGIDGLIGEFVAVHPNTVAVRSLGAVRYYSALAHVDAVVGNSSSGLYEAPSFKCPTVNIGERQTGRIKAASVIHCAGNRVSISAAIARALTLDCSNVVNPYGDGHASERIVAMLKSLGDPARLIRKRFVDHKLADAA